MTREELHKSLIRHWFEDGVSSNDPGVAARVAAEVFTDDYVDGDAPGAPQTRDEFVAMIRDRVMPTFADIEARVEIVLAEGDMAASYVSFEGTHVAPFRGVPATGKRIRFHEATLSCLEGDRIAWVRGKADWLAVFEQMGASVRAGA